MSNQGRRNTLSGISADDPHGMPFSDREWLAQQLQASEMRMQAQIDTLAAEQRRTDERLDRYFERESQVTIIKPITDSSKLPPPPGTLEIKRNNTRIRGNAYAVLTALLLLLAILVVVFLLKGCALPELVREVL